jgi:outer membrane protein assembly factor BamB
MIAAASLLHLRASSSPSLHTRAWNDSLSDAQYRKADQIERLLRSSNDARGLERLESLRWRAIQGPSQGVGNGVANAAVLAGVIGGAIVGHACLGGLGVVLGFFGGGMVAAETAALLVKGAAELRLDHYLNKVTARGSGYPDVLPAVSVSSTPEPSTRIPIEDVRQAISARYPNKAQNALLAGGSGRMRELETMVTRQLLYERGERTDPRVCTLWSYDTPHHVATDTAYDADHQTMYTRVGKERCGELTAFDPDGKVRWSFPGTAKSPPVVANGKVYFQTDGALHVVDPAGHELWSVPTQPGNVWNDRPPAVAPDGTVYVIDGIKWPGTGEPNMRLRALRDGREIWRSDMRGSCTGDPQVLCGRDGTVYVTAQYYERERSVGGFMLGDRQDRDYLLALRPDGTPKFKAPVSFWPSYVATSLSEGPDGRIYAAHGERYLTAFEPDGKKRWTYELVDRVVVNHSSSHARLTQAPAVDRNGNVFLSTNLSASYPEGYLFGLSPDGKESWVRSTPGGFSSRPHIGPDGNIYVTTSTGELRAFDIQGRHVSSAVVGDVSWSNFSFGDDGRVFLNTDRQIVGYQTDPDKACVVEPDDAPRTLPQGEGTVKDDGDYLVIGGIRLRKHHA